MSLSFLYSSFSLSIFSTLIYYFFFSVFSPFPTSYLEEEFDPQISLIKRSTIIFLRRKIIRKKIKNMLKYQVAEIFSQIMAKPSSNTISVVDI